MLSAFLGQPAGFYALAPATGSVISVSTSGSITILASSQHPVHMATSGSSLFWTDDDEAGTASIFRSSGVPGDALELATLDGHPSGLAVDGEFAWIGLIPDAAGRGRLARVPLDGGQVEDMAEVTCPEDIRADSGHVFIASSICNEGDVSAVLEWPGE